MASSLPSPPKEWKTQVDQIKPFNANIHQMLTYSSASKIEHAQFLSLRALWKKKELKQFRAIAYVPQEHLNEAEAYLKGNKGFQAYLSQIRVGKKYDSPFPDVESFSQALASQLEIVRVPADYDEMEPDSS
jgi:hypothetical protein